MPALLKIQDLNDKSEGGEKEKVKSKKVILSSKEPQGVGATMITTTPGVTTPNTIQMQPPQSQPLLVSSFVYHIFLGNQTHQLPLNQTPESLNVSVFSALLESYRLL